MKMTHTVTIMPQGLRIPAEDGERLLELLRFCGILVDAVCGGQGKCGKCVVSVDGADTSACRYYVHSDICVTLPERKKSTAALGLGSRIAFDIGTTGVVCFLIEDSGNILSASALNPQVSYGADVVSRIQSARGGSLAAQSEAIRRCMTELIGKLCAAPDKVERISVVGNPAMQQLFLGMDVGNLVDIPYEPAIRSSLSLPAAEYLPICPNALIYTLPDPSAYVGADTVACVLSTGMYMAKERTLLVDIGTNGEIVLADSHRMLCCATAAGPALEGGGIKFGMRGDTGAVDKVSLSGEKPVCRVIGGGEAVGICGSGLVDAVATFTDMGLLDRRGRILTDSGVLPLCDGLYLTQEDVRAFQSAKAAIAAGIETLISMLGEPETVLLAGAFGSALDPVSACRTGLIPPALKDRIRAVGNAAGAGAVMTAKSTDTLCLCESIAGAMEYVELAGASGFARRLAENMYLNTPER